MSFPKNLVAYEIALERAFRMLLGSHMDSHLLPDQESVGDAFFRQLDPAEFARQWLAEEKLRIADAPGSEQETEENHFSSGQDDQLF